MEEVPITLAGKSKLEAENHLLEYSKRTDGNVFIYRLPNVFGKWSKPNYNGVIATWCYNIANNLDIQVNDEKVELNLVYIDDVIKSFIKNLDIFWLLACLLLFED